MSSIQHPAAIFDPVPIFPTLKSIFIEIPPGYYTYLHHIAILQLMAGLHGFAVLKMAYSLRKKNLGLFKQK